MKSKISFFNKTVFLKNVTLFWPIWTVYTLVLLIAQPAALWFSYNDGYRFTPLTEEQKTEYLLQTMGVKAYIWIIFIMAIITGMAVFHYLYQGRSANMIHSLPVDRTQLFGTNVISGFVFLIIPQILTFLVTMSLCLYNRVTQLEYLVIWILILIGISIIAFSMVTICAFCTGQLFALPIYVIILNGLAYWVYAIVNYFVSGFAYGVDYGSIMDGELVVWFSPFERLLNHVEVIGIYEAHVFAGIEVKGIGSVVIYQFVAVGLLVAAYLIYQKRHIEKSGDFITVNRLRPIFRWGVGTTGAFFVSLLLKNVFEKIGRGFSLPLYVLILLICGTISYFVADMFVKKSFKVFQKKNWVKCGMFSGILLVTFVALCAYSSHCETYIPSEDKIRTASVSNYSTCEFEGEEVEKVTRIHTMILEHLDEMEVTDATQNYEFIRIRYEMKSGNTITRRYQIPIDGIGERIRRDVYEMEMDADNFLRNKICKQYDQVEEFVSGTLNYSLSEKYVNIYESEEEHYDDRYRYEKMTPEQCSILYEAVIQDAKAQKLQPYNGVYYQDYEKNDSNMMDKRYYYAELNFTYMLPQYEECYINFGPDCTNIIKALIECDLIESEDQISWY